MKGSWNGPSWTSGSYGKAGKGFQTRPWAQTQYGKGFGKQKGLNEVSDWSQGRMGSQWDPCLDGKYLPKLNLLIAASPNHARLRWLRVSL